MRDQGKILTMGVYAGCLARPPIAPIAWPLSFILLTLLGNYASSAESAWIEIEGGLYRVPSHWFFGIPGPTDRAIFDLPAEYSVTFASPETIGNLEFRHGAVSLDLAGHPVVVENELQVGSVPGALAKLLVEGGQLNGGRLRLGIEPASQGSLRLRSNARWTGSSGIQIGELGRGTIWIDQGAILRDEFVSLGHASSGHGSILLAGPSSRLEVAGPLDIGIAGWAELNAGPASQATANNLRLAVEPGSVARLSATGANATILVTGSAAWGRRGAASIEIADGARFEAGELTLGEFSGGSANATVNGPGARLSVAGTLHVGDGGTASLDVLSGARTDAADANIKAAASQSSTVRVRGPSSALNISRNLQIGDSAQSGPASLVVDNGAAVNIGTSGAGTLSIAASGRVILDGGAISTRSWNQGGQFDFLSGRLQVVGGEFRPFQQPQQLHIDSVSAERPSILELSAGAVAMNVNEVSIGNRGSALLLLSSSAQLNSLDADLGANVGARGEARLSGGNTRWSLHGDLSVGGDSENSGGLGILNVDTGASLLVDGAFRLWPDGAARINRGMLSVGKIDLRGGTFDFVQGTLKILQPVVADGPWLDAVLGPDRALRSSQRLEIDRLRLSAPLQLSGGQIVARTLTVDERLDATSGHLLAAEIAISLGGRANVGRTATIQFSSLTNDGEIQLSDSQATLQGGGVLNRGLLFGQGRVESSLSNMPVGQILADSGERLVLVADSHRNAGRIDATNRAAIDFQGELFNEPGAQLRARDATLRFNSRLVNRGTVTLDGTAAEIFGPLDNRPDGTLSVGVRASATIHGPIVNDGSIFLLADAQATVAGPITGTGTIRLQPGAKMLVHALQSSSLVLGGAGAELHLQAESPRVAFRVQSLTIANGATLHLDDRDLILDYSNAPTPMVAIRDYVSNGLLGADGAGRILGPLSASNTLVPVVIDNALAAATSWQGELLAAPFHQIIVTHAHKGDLNLDGIVDAQDYLPIDNHFAQSGDWLAGDANFDGQVNVQDYLVVDNHFGARLPPPPASLPLTLPSSSGDANPPTLDIATVPEPSTALLSLCCLVILATIAHRRSSAAAAGRVFHRSQPPVANPTCR